MARSLVVKATAGTDSPERCNQAFTVAAAAVATGLGVSLWLTGEAAWLALPGRAKEFDLPEAAPLDDLLHAVLSSGTVTICTQCAARRGIGEIDVISGVRIAGGLAFRTGGDERWRPGPDLLTPAGGKPPARPPYADRVGGVLQVAYTVVIVVIFAAIAACSAYVVYALYRGSG